MKTCLLAINMAEVSYEFKDDDIVLNFPDFMQRFKSYLDTCSTMRAKCKCCSDFVYALTNIVTTSDRSIRCKYICTRYFVNQVVRFYNDTTSIYEYCEEPIEHATQSCTSCYVEWFQQFCDFIEETTPFNTYSMSESCNIHGTLLPIIINCDCNQAT